RQLVDGAFEPEARELLRLTGARPEPGTPKQPLRLSGPERAPPHGDTRHAKEHRQRFGRTGSPIGGDRAASAQDEGPACAGRSWSVLTSSVQGLGVAARAACAFTSPQPYVVS